MLDTQEFIKYGLIDPQDISVSKQVEKDNPYTSQMR